MPSSSRIRCQAGGRWAATNGAEAGRPNPERELLFQKTCTSCEKRNRGRAGWRGEQQRYPIYLREAVTGGAGGGLGRYVTAAKRYDGGGAMGVQGQHEQRSGRSTTELGMHTDSIIIISGSIKTGLDLSYETFAIFFPFYGSLEGYNSLITSTDCLQGEERSGR